VSIPRAYSDKQDRLLSAPPPPLKTRRGAKPSKTTLRESYFWELRPPLLGTRLKTSCRVEGGGTAHSPPDFVAGVGKTSCLYRFAKAVLLLAHEQGEDVLCLGMHWQSVGGEAAHSSLAAPILASHTVRPHEMHEVCMSAVASFRNS
jgi:hypothetical protein